MSGPGLAVPPLLCPRPKLAIPLHRDCPPHLLLPPAGHLRATPPGFSKLFRPDVTFFAGGLLFPAHSIVLAVSSRFFADFFRILHGSSGRPAPDQPISLSSGAVQCAALGARSFDSYLSYAYSGALPPGLDAAAAVELLRLSAFFGNPALSAALEEHLSARVAAGEWADRGGA